MHLSQWIMVLRFDENSEPSVRILSIGNVSCPSCLDICWKMVAGQLHWLGCMLKAMHRRTKAWRKVDECWGLLWPFCICRYLILTFSLEPIRKFLLGCIACRGLNPKFKNSVALVSQFPQASTTKLKCGRTRTPCSNKIVDPWRCRTHTHQ